MPSPDELAMRLGILGGSFNPIHHGHLITALRAAEAARLDRVLFVPAAVSPLKDGRSLAPAADRLEMVRQALRGTDRLEACDLEIRRGGISYSIETLRELRRRTGARARLYWILGADAARLLPKWRSIEEVRRLARFVIVARTGDSVPRKMPKDVIVEAPLIEISSSEIRGRIRRGLSIRYLVPEAVERFIRRKGLYRT